MSRDAAIVDTRPADAGARLPSPSVPPTREERDRLLRLARECAREQGWLPPVPLAALQEHATEVLSRAAASERYRDFVAILLNNELWREAWAAVPFERRLLLLPKCLRSAEECPARFDEFGLVCAQCGRCAIKPLQEEAERLGCAVLVAEGSAVVMSLIQTGRIEGILGVSCTAVLAKAFPHMEAAAVPGIAIPLHQDGCANTTMDIDWVWDFLHLSAEDRSHRLDLSALRDEVDAWFSAESLARILGAGSGPTERAARGWLGRAGKRWRPFLTAAAYQAMRPDPEAPMPDDLRRLAVAVECFHKASLVHDDIEDGDLWRYGEKTLHAEQGLPFALNVGDLLIGEGYRLIGECQAAPDRIAQMLRAAAEGQRQLCLGQGAELAWMRAPAPLSPAEVIDIFRHKTAPAFEVSLRLGTILAGGHEVANEAIGPYSGALGVAYQIRDDLEDFGGGAEATDLQAHRPGILLALAGERAPEERRPLVEALWRRALPEGWSTEETERWYRELGVDAEARALLDRYRTDAIESLAALPHAGLKSLLRRVIGKIFNPAEIRGWCDEAVWHRTHG